PLSMPVLMAHLWVRRTMIAVLAGVALLIMVLWWMLSPGSRSVQWSGPRVITPAASPPVAARPNPPQTTALAAAPAESAVAAQPSLADQAARLASQIAAVSLEPEVTERAERLAAEAAAAGTA